MTQMLCIKVIWALLAFPGLLTTAWVLVDVYRDRRRLYVNRLNGVLMDMACQHILQEWLRLLSQILLVSRVLYVLYVFADLHEPRDFGLIVTSGVVSCLLSASSVLEFCGRRRTSKVHVFEVQRALESEPLRKP